jgi:paired amphipathic helix protein Sin3a
MEIAAPADAQNKRVTKAESPSGEEAEMPPRAPSTEPQTLASAEEVAFFDKVKKYVDDKVTYHEFLKLINLFSQDLIDVPTLLDRAEHFIGNSPEVWYAFKKMVVVDGSGNPPSNPRSRQLGYGFGGMIALEGAHVENTPMLERVKPDMSGSRVKTYGPSYRKLPKTVSFGIVGEVRKADNVGSQPGVFRSGSSLLGGPER